MMRTVYTSDARVPLYRLVSPAWIMCDLLRHRELIATCVGREFYGAYRETFLGTAWQVLNPLILLSLFTLVFGYIFNGKFNPAGHETPPEFAVALFVGLSFYLCIGQALTSSPALILSNSAYVKTLSFPLEVLPVAAVLNMMVNLLIGLALCMLGFLAIHGFVHWTAILLVPLIVCTALICLGLSWFLSSLAVFVRDVPSITSPLSMVLMFISGVFFPMTSVPQSIRWLFKLNPIAIIIEQARAVFLYGQVPNLLVMAAVAIVSVAVAIGGYWFFQRTKAAFADVL